MALHQAAHHRRLARGPEGRARFLRALDRNQGLDDLAALDQQAVYRLVDAIDLLAQFRERRLAASPRLGFAGFTHGCRCSLSGDVIAVARAERKENIDRVSSRFLALVPRTRSS